jgi:hypothetical protein
MPAFSITELVRPNYLMLSMSVPLQISLLYLSYLTELKSFNPNRAAFPISTARANMMSNTITKFQSQSGGVQLTYFWKSGNSPIVDRATLLEKQEQVTWQLKSDLLFDQNWSK